MEEEKAELAIGREEKVGGKVKERNEKLPYVGFAEISRGV